MKSVRDSLRQVRRLSHIILGRDIWQGVQMRCDRVDFGNNGARWCLCPDGLSETSVVYSIGVGEEISFDLELIRRFGVEVHAFDPTPRSIKWIRSQDLPQKFVFHPYGLADYDGTCKFLPPENPSHVSHSMIRHQSPWSAIELPVHRLVTAMKELGHSKLDVLKMDIEGAEYLVIADMLACNLYVRQLLVEFHHRWPEVGIAQTKKAIQGLNRAGYRIFNVSTTGEEYSFLVEKSATIGD